MDNGPVDYITHEARYSLSEEKLIRQQVKCNKNNSNRLISWELQYCCFPHVSADQKADWIFAFAPATVPNFRHYDSRHGVCCFWAVHHWSFSAKVCKKWLKVANSISVKDFFFPCHLFILIWRHFATFARAAAILHSRHLPLLMYCTNGAVERKRTQMPSSSKLFKRSSLNGKECSFYKFFWWDLLALIFIIKRLENLG